MLVKHWNGRDWAQVPAAQLQGLSPDLVTASSATDAWLFQSDPPASLHWNGSSWTKVAVPSWVFASSGLGGQYIDAADVARGNVWVFDQTDYSAARKSAYAARYHDGRWTRSYLPDMPIEVDALSASDIWADGTPASGSGPAALMHWTGRRWTAIAIPKAGSAGGIAATGPKSVWLAWYPARSGAAEYLLHWNGTTWSRVSLPAGDTTLSLAGDGGTGLWVTGVGPGRAQKQLFLHWSAGRWTRTVVPSRADAKLGQVDELALVPGTRSLWAIGHLYGTGAADPYNRGAIWRYNP
jgi:hypothetical protein